MWAPQDEIREINLHRQREVETVQAFLATFGLAFQDDVEYTVGMFRGESLVGTGSLAGEVLRNIAVADYCRSEGVAASIVGSLIQEQARRGRFHHFIFTRPGNVATFAALGFAEIARAEPHAALLEAGIGSIGDYCRELTKAVSPSFFAGKRRAAVVVNGNPFTLGHRELISRAARENDGVAVFVVSEDRSLLPFDDRLRLVRAGVAGLPDVNVLPCGKYLISAATFPGYFTRGEESTAAQARLDITVFARHIAPALGITVRYVGEEPYCPVTAQYNQAMGDILPVHGIDLRVIPRLAVGGEVVSASSVRAMIRRGDWQGIRRFVPASTFEYFNSPAAVPVIERIRNTASRH